MKWIKDRFPILSIWLCLLLTYIGLVILNGPYSEYKYDGKASAQTTEQSHKRPETPPPIANVKQTPAANVSKNNEDWQTRDNKAQIQMMRAAWVAVGLTFVGLILVGFTLHYTKKAAQAAATTLIEAGNATKAAQDTLASDRAWLVMGDGVTVVSNKGSYVDNLGDTPVQFLRGLTYRTGIMNAGRSPAIGVDMFHTQWVGTGEPPESFSIMRPRSDGYDMLIAPQQVYNTNDKTLFDQQLALWFDRRVRWIIYVQATYKTIYSDDIQYLRLLIELVPPAFNFEAFVANKQGVLVEPIMQNTGTLDAQKNRQ